jgi:hypothetical protein
MGFKYLTSFGVQMLMPGILERRRRLNAERSEAIERHEVPLELLIAALRLSNAAAQRSRISLPSIFNPSFADFNR